MEDNGIYALRDYVTQLGSVDPSEMDYDQVHEALVERVPYITRHEATDSVFEGSGVNKLLDRLNEILLVQCVELLEVTANE